MDPHSYYSNKPLVGQADPEFERLLAEEQAIQEHDDKAYMEHIKAENDELVSELKRHHRDFQDISMVVTLVRHHRMTPETACSIIQNIVG